MTSSDSAQPQVKVDATSPRQCCVICHRPHTPGSSLLKILKCLHSMCVDCLRQYVGKDGAVNCLKCWTIATSGTPGARLEDCLVNWPAEDAPNETETALETTCSVPVCQDPECEGDDEIANSFCVDCDLRLCDGHGKIHTKKRTSRGHRVVASPGERRGVARSCPLHPNSTVEKCCGQCNMLVCDRCIALDHFDHSDQVDLQTAGDQKRGDMRSRLDEVIDNWRDVLQDAKETVSRHLQAIHDRTEEVSAMISADVEDHIKTIRKREKDLLSQLDQARWTQVKELEMQSQLVEEKTYRTECCDFLLSKLSNHALLASEETLEFHITDIAQAFEGVTEDSPLLPTVQYDLTYQGFAEVENGFVSNLGAVLMDGRDVSTLQQVEARSTLVVHVAPCFDPFTVNRERLVFHSNNSQVQNSDARMRTVGHDGFSGVATLGAFCHGIIRCRFQVLQVGVGMFVGVMGQKCCQRGECTEEKPFLGWFCDDDNARFCVGNVAGLGQPWKDGDVISLELDCDKHRLTGFHERTGASETITIPSAKLCFGVEVSRNAKLRILRG